ncbi:MAG: hypothetical protein ACYSWU_00260 [Planctomycetota bacterium]
MDRLTNQECEILAAVEEFEQRIEYLSDRAEEEEKRRKAAGRGWWPVDQRATHSKARIQLMRRLINTLEINYNGKL